VPVPVPDDVSLSTFGDCATIELRKEWSPPGTGTVQSMVVVDVFTMVVTADE
jgi:hypothetical protein